MKKMMMGTAAAAILAAGPALALTEARAATDLNLRAGPGPDHAIVAVIPSDGAVTLEGCLEAANWCRVSYDGQLGWAYGDYLTADAGGEAVFVYPNRDVIAVEEVEFEEEGSGAAEGAMFGALVGGVLAGPAGLAATSAGVAASTVGGAMVGGALGDAADPDVQTRVRTYVVENPVEPVYLDGEVVLGAGVPETVEVYPIPETAYSYVYVNGNQAVLDNSDRRIVYILR